jgi:hypothetical protein
MTGKTAKPTMHDPADRDIHSTGRTPPYPAPQDAELAEEAADDTADPSETTPGAPSDRAQIDADGEFKRALQKQEELLGPDYEDWKKGKTQDAPPKK